MLQRSDSSGQPEPFATLLASSVAGERPAVSRKFFARSRREFAGSRRENEQIVSRLAQVLGNAPRETPRLSAKRPDCLRNAQSVCETPRLSANLRIANRQ